MTITYTTTIDAMYTVQQPDPNYVVNVIYTVSGTDGTNQASIGGNLQFSSEQAPENFIPYDQLTEATVLGWIDASGALPNLQACVAGQIESIVNPPVSPENTPLPWSA